MQSSLQETVLEAVLHLPSYLPPTWKSSCISKSCSRLSASYIMMCTSHTWGFAQRISIACLTASGSWAASSLLHKSSQTTLLSAPTWISLLNLQTYSFATTRISASQHQRSSKCKAGASLLQMFFPLVCCSAWSINASRTFRTEVHVDSTCFSSMQRLSKIINTTWTILNTSCRARDTFKWWQRIAKYSSTSCWKPTTVCTNFFFTLSFTYLSYKARRPTIKEIMYSDWLNDPFVKAVKYLDGIMELDQQ